MINSLGFPIACVVGLAYYFVADGLITVEQGLELKELLDKK